MEGYPLLLFFLGLGIVRGQSAQSLKASKL